MRMKVQDPPNTTRVERAHRILILRTSKSIALIQMYVGPPGELGEKILDLRIQRAKTERTPRKEITTQDAVIQIEAEVGGETKIDLCIACSTSET
jgi:hypothetical protein